MAGRLVICATPIGNLGDVSPRMREALAAADLVYAEDTRRTRSLLEHLGLAPKVRSYFAGNERRRTAELATDLEAGRVVVLVTDAGMPSVSDPGVSAVRTAVDAGADVSVVPGPSAVTAALAGSGLPAERFVFEGFLPRKGRARADRLGRLAAEERTIVLFAATARVAEDLVDLAGALGHDRSVVVARELTKLHEELWRGTLGAAAGRWSHEVEPRGEFTLVVAGATGSPPAADDLVGEVLAAEAHGLTRSEAVRQVAADAGASRRELYQAVIRDRGGA
jgi:16S rRNA (cytidine1402-2'-O)-methyltransferase